MQLIDFFKFHYVCSYHMCYSDKILSKYYHSDFPMRYITTYHCRECDCQKILICSVILLTRGIYVCFSKSDGVDGPLTRYVQLRVAHAPGRPGTFSPPQRLSDPDMHLGTCVRHVPWCMPGSLTSGLLWSRWRGKRSRHSRCMRNSQFYVSGKRSKPLGTYHKQINNDHDSYR